MTETKCPRQARRKKPAPTPQIEEKRKRERDKKTRQAALRRNGYEYAGGWLDGAIFEKAGRRLQEPCFKEECPRSSRDLWNFVVKLARAKATEVLRPPPARTVCLCGREG